MSIAMRPRFSTMTGFPSGPESDCAITRAVKSLSPPACDVTMRTGREGKVCAEDAVANSESAARSDAAANTRVACIIRSRRRYALPELLHAVELEDLLEAFAIRRSVKEPVTARLHAAHAPKIDEH